jgi:hypothetical protein
MDARPYDSYQTWCLFFATKCVNSDTLVYGARAQIDVLELNIPKLLKGT